MTLPLRTSVQKGMAFLKLKTDWVLEHIALAPPKTALGDGAAIPVMGVMHRIERKAGRGVPRQHEGILTVHCAPEFTTRRVRDFLKKHLQDYVQHQAVLLAGILDKPIRKVRIGEMRSRWGSCTSSGRLAFNWRLVFAPQDIVDYLIAHEVAHLVEMNHSKRFWRCVAQLCPDYKHAQGWLKKNGNTLYSYE